MNQALRGDSLDLLSAMDPGSMDACVTDPSYGLGKSPNPQDVMRAWMAGQEFDTKRGGFMGERWDSFVPGPLYWLAVRRVLKPGAHCVAFGGTRTYDWLTMGMRFAGLEIRTSLHWLHASGMNKSGYLSYKLERTLCTKRGDEYRYDSDGSPMREEPPFRHPDANGLWGWAGTLKPSHEPIVVARKPFRGSMTNNAIEHGGLGALHVDRCRVAAPGETISTHGHREHGKGVGDPDYGTFDAQQTHQSPGQRLGRWPPDVLLTHAPECRCVGHRTVKGDSRAGQTKGSRPGGFLDVGSNAGDGRPAGVLHGDEAVPVWRCVPGCPVAALDEQAGHRKSGLMTGPQRGWGKRGVYGESGRSAQTCYADEGGVSRFYPVLSWDDDDFLPVYYASKAARREKEAARPDDFDGTIWNSHKTVKPLSVLDWLVKLVVPEGGCFVDPFVGSGTSLVVAERLGLTGCVGMDKIPLHHEIAERRLAFERE